MFLRRKKDTLPLPRIKPQIVQTCRLVTVPTVLPTEVSQQIFTRERNILVNILLIIDPFFFTTLLCNSMDIGRLSLLKN